MARYIVDSQIDNHEKYYFIREQESQDIVLLPEGGWRDFGGGTQCGR